MSKSSETGRINSKVKAIYIHPDWNVDVLIYEADIALVELEHEIQFTNLIRPICLSDSQSIGAESSEGIVVGIGRTDSGKASSIAQKLKIPIYSFHVCAKNSTDHTQLVNGRTFCGGPGNGRGGCTGDSGSGLYVSQNGRFYLRGIVSSSIVDELNECNVNTYGIYTDALAFFRWIKSGHK